MKKQVIVSGSLAYDRIMDFPGNFADHILPDKIHAINVCFQVNGMQEKVGGTAGNIAYALKMMGEDPVISATIGRDFQHYFDWMKKNGISTDRIKVIEDEFTAGAYITTDKADNQITGFNPGAMKYSSSLDFDRLDAEKTMLIVSPGNLLDMVNYPRACKKKGVDYIFDPGQSLPALDAKDLVEVVDGCRALICNDYEIDLFMNKTGMDEGDLREKAGAVIVTMGELGSRVYTMNHEVRIPPAGPKQVVDPTGAGDAYRGGLVSGLVQGKDIEESARMGSACASFAVECYGTQCYSFTPEEFQKRLESCS
ncbi:MAG: carbohydrate kinase family protein [Dehalococcoidia bacterium]|jgi:adenosine kinase